MQGISWLAEDILAVQDLVSSLHVHSNNEQCTYVKGTAAGCCKAVTKRQRLTQVINSFRTLP